MINLSIPRLVRDIELEYLVRLVRDYQPQRILEIGAAFGAVTWHLAANSGAEIHTIDIWIGEKIDCRIGFEPITQRDCTLDFWKETVKPFQNRCYAYHGRSQETNIPGQFDMIWIDGDHTLEGIRKDLEKWYQSLSNGGVFLGHDYVYDTVKQAVNEFAVQHSLRVNLPLENVWRLR